jgi:glycosyltransferase involved in cell wall biosynthesis
MLASLRPESGHGSPGRKVLLTTDAVGGVWTYALDLAAGLRALGFVTTLAVLGPEPSPVQLAEAQRIADIEVIVTRLPLDWLAKDSRDVVAAGRALARVAASQGVDIVHLSSPALAVDATYPAPVVMTCHSCLATWWSAVRGEDTPMPDDFAWRTELVNEGLRAADVVVAPSRAFAEALAATYALESLPVVVRNGRAAPDPQSQRQQLRSAPELFAFTAGRLWDEGKNIAAIDAAAQNLSIPVLAAGPLAGPDGGRTHLRFAEPLGALPAHDVAAYLARRPMFVSAALYEPFGLAVLEAAFAGSPLVLSDIPTFRELWSGAAIFVPPRDPDAIARALRELASDAGLRHALGRAALRRSGQYTLAAVASETARVYRSLIGEESALPGSSFAAVG